MQNEPARHDAFHWWAIGAVPTDVVVPAHAERRSKSVTAIKLVDGCLYVTSANALGFDNGTRLGVLRNDREDKVLGGLRFKQLHQIFQEGLRSTGALSSRYTA